MKIYLNKIRLSLFLFNGCEYAIINLATILLLFINRAATFIL
jgi:hypothetical protein